MSALVSRTSRPSTITALAVGTGQLLVRDHPGAGLEPPQHGQLVAETVVLERRHLHEVVRAGAVDHVGWQGRRLDRVHGPDPIPTPDHVLVFDPKIGKEIYRLRRTDRMRLSTPNLGWR